MRYRILSHASPIQSAKPHHLLCKKALHIARYTIRKRALYSAKKALHVLHKTDTPQKNFTQCTYFAKDPYILGQVELNTELRNSEVTTSVFPRHEGRFQILLGWFAAKKGTQSKVTRAK